MAGKPTRHYRPVYINTDKVVQDVHYAIPQHWNHVLPPKEGLDELEIVGTSFKEPKCKNLLCALDDTNESSQHLVNWYGPALKGKIITTGWDPKTMTPPNEWDEDEDGGKRNADDGARKVLNA